MGAFVPIYGFYILLKVVGRPGWWLIWIFIPIVNYIVIIIVFNDLSKSFGHGVGFTLGLIFLSWIFLAILAWGSSTYRGPSAGTARWSRRRRRRHRPRWHSTTVAPLSARLPRRWGRRHICSSCNSSTSRSTASVPASRR